MTCIVGIVYDGIVYIGGDSASSTDNQISVRKDPKVFKHGDAVIGFTTSWRMGQILRYEMPPITHTLGQDVHQELVRTYIPALRKVAKDAGCVQQHSGADYLGTFLIGLAGRLFYVESDFQVGEPTTPYWAVGSGAAYALGALAVTAVSGLGPLARIEQAIEIAQQFSPFVRKPVNVCHT